MKDCGDLTTMVFRGVILPRPSLQQQNLFCPVEPHPFEKYCLHATELKLYGFCIFYLHHHLRLPHTFIAWKFRFRKPNLKHCFSLLLISFEHVQCISDLLLLALLSSSNGIHSLEMCTT